MANEVSNNIWEYLFNLKIYGIHLCASIFFISDLGLEKILPRFPDFGLATWFQTHKNMVKWDIRRFTLKPPIPSHPTYPWISTRTLYCKISTVRSLIRIKAHSHSVWKCSRKRERLQIKCMTHNLMLETYFETMFQECLSTALMGHTEQCLESTSNTLYPKLQRLHGVTYGWILIAIVLRCSVTSGSKLTFSSPPSESCME